MVGAGRVVARDWGASMVGAEQLRLLERVSAGRGVVVDGSRARARAASHPHGERRVAHVGRWLGENAPGGVVRATYWLDARLGVVRSRPNLQLLPWGSVVASAGRVLVEPSVGVEVMVYLRDVEPGLAEEVEARRGDLWGLLLAEFGPGAGVDPSAYPRPVDVGVGTEGPAAEARRRAREFRQHCKLVFFRAMYGMRPREEDGSLADLLSLQDRVLARWPALWPPRLDREERVRVASERRLRMAGVWLGVGLEAERLGLEVVGFWTNEPVVEGVAGADVPGLTRALEDRAWGLLRSA